MTSNSSTSRTALALVAVIIAAACIWFFWVSNSDAHVSNTPQITEQSSSGKTEQGKADLPEQNNEPKPALQSGLEATTPKTVESEASRTDPQDFRVVGDEKYASVPDGHFFTTSGVTDLTPDEEVHTFRMSHRVYAYAAIHAPRKETVRITWFDSNNKEIPPSAYLDVTVNTGPVGYRVFTYRTFRTPGEYKVRLTNSVGIVIGEEKFEVFN